MQKQDPDDKSWRYKDIRNIYVCVCSCVFMEESKVDK